MTLSQLFYCPVPASLCVCISLFCLRIIKYLVTLLYLVDVSPNFIIFFCIKRLMLNLPLHSDPTHYLMSASVTPFSPTLCPSVWGPDSHGLRGADWAQSMAIFDKGAKTIQWKKDSIFSKWCWFNWQLACRRILIDRFLSPCTKLKSKWIKDFHIKPVTLKLMEK